MYEDSCYNNSFLKAVILRVDFPTPVPSLTNELPVKLANAALERFPIQEPRKTRSHELMVSPEKIQHTQSEAIEWHFHGRQRDKTLTIGPTVLLVNRGRYSTYEELREEFDAVLKTLFSLEPEIEGSRLGLRYINQIEIGDDEPLRWSKYIDNRLLGLFDRFTDPTVLTRAMHVVEFQHGEIGLKFQFGMPNPDFPSPIRRRQFVLDFNGYVQGPQGLEELSSNIEAAHERIQDLFEQSITDDLREAMRHG